MAELVYTQTTNLIPSDKLDGRGLVTRDNKHSVYSSKDKVALVVSELVTGENDSRDKRWYRWVTTESMGFYRRKNGRITPYRCVRPPVGKNGWGFYSAFPVLKMIEPDTTGPEFSDVFRDEVAKQMKITSQRDLYPILSELGVYDVARVPDALRLKRCLLARSREEYVSRILGKRWTDCTDRIFNTDIVGHMAIDSLRYILDKESVIEIVEKTHFPEDFTDSKTFEVALTQWPEILKRLDAFPLAVDKSGFKEHVGQYGFTWDFIRDFNLALTHLGKKDRRSAYVPTFTNPAITDIFVAK